MRRSTGAFSARLILAAAAIFAFCHVASAQTLDDILKRGKLIVGIDMNSPPYGYQDESQKPAGSEVETAQLMAKDLGVPLEIVPTTVANRVPYLATHRVDTIMATFAITPERAKSVWFSTPYGTTGSIVIAAKATKLTGLPDLDGKKIATTRGFRR